MGVVGAVAALAALPLFGCGSSNSASTSTAAATEGSGASTTTTTTAETRDVTVVLPVPLGLFWTPYIVANERYYPQHGLKVKFVSVDGSASAAQQVTTGNGFAASVATQEAYAAGQKGAKIVSIANLGHGLVDDVGVPEDSSIQSLPQLKGKSIGVPSASDGSVPLVKTLMKEAGVDEGSYQLPAVGAGGPAVAAALKSNRIAAYAHGISDVAPLKVNGGITLRSLMPNRYSDLPADGIVVQQSTMDDPQDRQAAIDLAAGFIWGARFLADKPQEAQRIVCDAVPRECTNDKLVAATLETVGQHYSQPTGDRAGAYDYTKVKSLFHLTASGEEPIPYDQVFTNKYVSDINKAADAAGGA